MNDAHSNNMSSCCCDCMEMKPKGYGVVLCAVCCYGMEERARSLSRYVRVPTYTR